VLRWVQMESTMAMQAVQPRVKDLQAKYANEPETLQVRHAEAAQPAAW
jgi:YidC/Oxa1 family membrane protein insertase